MPPPAINRRISWGTVLLIFLPFAAGYFLSYLYRTINAVLAPHLAEALELDAADLGMLTSVYFLAFAAFQLPLGVLLDRYRPARVEGALLLFAAAGAGLFAASDGLQDLVIGRALIGLGVSACLMASLKSFVLWFPSGRLPAVNGWVLAAGGLGALTATAPVEWVLGLTSWRGVFAGLALLTLLVAAALVLMVPAARPGAGAGGDLRRQWRGVVAVYSSPAFWRLAPVAALSIGAYLSIQGLWAGPWLRDVAGLAQAAAAELLFWAAAGMIAGYLVLGDLATRVSRWGRPPVVVALGGMIAFMGTELGLALGTTDGGLALMVGFGFFGTAGTLCYAILSQTFPPVLAGRVNTALNLLAFVAAFVMQWVLGVLIGRWPGSAGGYGAAGYGVAFGLVLLTQVLALGWYWLAGPAPVPGGDPDPGG